MQDQTDTQTSESIAVANNNVGNEVAYTDAIAAAINEANHEFEAVLPLRASGGRSRFVPSVDDSRPVKLFSANPENNIIELRRISQSEKESTIFFGKNVMAVFGSDVFESDDRTEVRIVLANGEQLSGYTLKSDVKKAIYLPKAFIPSSIELPGLGFTRPVRVIKIIVG